MAGENFIKIHGRLTRDVETATGSSSGKEWFKAEFSVAVDNAYPSKETSFYSCYMFGKRAEALAKNFRKGSEIVVWGEHQQEPYTNKEGKIVRPWKLKAEAFDFCGSKSDKSGGDPSSNNSGFTEPSDDDIPF